MLGPALCHNCTQPPPPCLCVIPRFLSRSLLLRCLHYFHAVLLFSSQSAWVLHGAFELGLETPLGGDSPLDLGGSEVTPLSFCLWDCIHHVGEKRQGTWREEARFGGDEPHRYDHSEYRMYPQQRPPSDSYNSRRWSWDDGGSCLPSVGYGVNRD